VTTRSVSEKRSRCFQNVRAVKSVRNVFGVFLGQVCFEFRWKINGFYLDKENQNRKATKWVAQIPSCTDKNCESSQTDIRKVGGYKGDGRGGVRAKGAAREKRKATARALALGRIKKSIGDGKGTEKQTFIITLRLQLWGLWE